MGRAEEIAAGLSEAQRAFLITLRDDEPTYDEGILGEVQRRQRAKYQFWMTHAPHKAFSLRPLTRLGLLDGLAMAGMIWVNLSRSGLAVRRVLEGQ